MVGLATVAIKAKAPEGKREDGDEVALSGI
jgi:hypothetical protein